MQALSPPLAVVGRLLPAVWRKLSGGDRSIKLAELIPWDELEDDYATQFCKGFGALAKLFVMALGELIIKARLGLTDEEVIDQNKDNLTRVFPA